MFQYGFPKLYWCYAISHVVHIINKLPSISLNGKSPCEILHDTPPTYMNLKMFGSLCYASTLEHNKTKLDYRSRKCVFLGYKNGINGYVVLDMFNR